MATWARLGGCSAEPRTVLEKGKVKVMMYPGCATGIAVVLVTIDDMGHKWPGAKPAPQILPGPGSDDVDATAMMVSFFLEHPRK
jgi:polyhydroxybutyrate depolymerase